MVAPAPHRSTRRTLIRSRVDWPPTPERLYDAITVPPGFRKQLVLGRVRIGHPDKRVDQELLDLAEQLADELPDLCGLDIYAGRIVVGGFPRLAHSWAMAGLTRQLLPVADTLGWWLPQDSAVVNPHLREHIGPDVMVVRPNAPTYDEAFCGEGVPLVAEITSPGNADRDYGGKRKFYGQAGVAIYLIVDLQQDEVVLHTRPYDSGYRHIVTVPLGEPLSLPEPFGLALDTAALRYKGSP
jgi:Uma2 family endonuclease